MAHVICLHSSQRSRRTALLSWLYGWSRAE